MTIDLTQWIVNRHMDLDGNYVFGHPMLFGRKEDALKFAVEDRSRFLQSKQGETFLDWYDDTDEARAAFLDALNETGHAVMDDDMMRRRVYSLDTALATLDISVK